MDEMGFLNWLFRLLGDTSALNKILIIVATGLSYSLYQSVKWGNCNSKEYLNSTVQVIKENTASNMKISDAMQKISESTDRICTALNTVDKAITTNTVILESCKKN